MLRTTLLTALTALLALALAAPAAAGEGWLGDVDAAVAAAEHRDTLILVDFYADWCSWCKKLEAEVFSTPRFREATSEWVKLRVDTEDEGEGAALADRMGVGSLPSVMLLTPELARVAEVGGFVPTEQFLARLEAGRGEWRELQGRIAAVDDGTPAEVLAELAEESHVRRDGAAAAALYRRLLAGDPGDVVRRRYLLADALRLEGRFDEAAGLVEALRGGLGDGAAEGLAERLDLLGFKIARDRGRCGDAIVALEAFLERHPESPFQYYAERSLMSLQGGGSALCT